jgi:hypothetical protein
MGRGHNQEREGAPQTRRRGEGTTEQRAQHGV